MVDLTDPIQVSSLAGVVLAIVVVALAILLKREQLVIPLMDYVSLGIETKYLDKALTSNATLQNTGANGSTPLEGNAGATYESRYWYEYNFATDPNTPLQESASSNLMQGVFNGTNAVTRIGNKVDASYLRGNMTVTAMKLVQDNLTVTLGFQPRVYTQN